MTLEEARLVVKCCESGICCDHHIDDVIEELNRAFPAFEFWRERSFTPIQIAERSRALASNEKTA